MDKKRALRNLLLVMAILGIGCSKESLYSGTEVTNGNCVGKIYNPDSTVAADALVRLIPADYNPYSQTRGIIDSTVTDKDGNYSFVVFKPDYYNIIAEKGTASCIQDSIPVFTDSRVVVDNDTLRISGKLSGVVRLMPGDDKSRTVILIPGTNVYAVPSDTSGNFEMPLLPEGSYALQIFTTLDGYCVFDTNVIIREGGQTHVDITLPSVNAPSIANLIATYDSSTMYASLSWPMPDTSKFFAYALYRTSRLGNDTNWILDNSTIAYNDDLVSFGGDSVHYQLAAIGKNYKEGYRTTSRLVSVCSEVYCVKEIDLSRFATGLYPRLVYLHPGWGNRIFLVGEFGIFALDTNGDVQEDYRLDLYDEEKYPLVLCFQSDCRGNSFILKRSASGDARTLIKLDANLSVIAQTQVDTSCQSIVAAGNGTIYAFFDVTDSITGQTTSSTVKEYDSSLTFLTMFSTKIQNILSATHFGDTLVIHEYTDEKDYAHFFDTAFSSLSDVAVDDYNNGSWGNPRYNNEIRYGGFIAAPSGIFLSIFAGWTPERKESSLLLFTDRNGKFLARIAVPGTGNPVFDSSDNMYLITNTFTDYDDMGPDNPVKKLFKYSMKPLLRKLSL
jgi:hypothetical protein